MIKHYKKNRNQSVVKSTTDNRTYKIFIRPDLWEWWDDYHYGPKPVTNWKNYRRFQYKS